MKLPRRITQAVIKVNNYLGFHPHVLVPVPIHNEPGAAGQGQVVEHLRQQFLQVGRVQRLVNIRRIGMFAAMNKPADGAVLGQVDARAVDGRLLQAGGRYRDHGFGWLRGQAMPGANLMLFVVDGHAKSGFILVPSSKSGPRHSLVVGPGHEPIPKTHTGGPQPPCCPKFRVPVERSHG